MRTRSTATELEDTRTAIRCAATAHHAEDNARGRETVENNPDHPNHTRAAAAWLMKQRQEQIALDDADIDERIRHRRGGGTGSDQWTYELMHRAAQTGRELAYWEGIHATAHRSGSGFGPEKTGELAAATSSTAAR